jgi:hypothetical protein
MDKKNAMVVLIQDGKNPLLLSDVHYNAAGMLTSGWVENGGWRLEATACEFVGRTYEGQEDDRWPKSGDIEIVEIPAGKKGHYNALICWAEDELRARRAESASPESDAGPAPGM